MADTPLRVVSDRKTQGDAAQAKDNHRADVPAIRPFGWGADLDPGMRPAVPMERKPARLEGVHWDTPSAQPKQTEILYSLERPRVTPIFGSTLPPKGLSGVLRRHAFGYSESDLRHWLVLLLADRVDVGEGLLADLARGHVPNILGEMGLRAELKHNPGGATRKALMVAGIAALAIALHRARKRRSGRRL